MPLWTTKRATPKRAAAWRAATATSCSSGGGGGGGFATAAAAVDVVTGQEQQQQPLLPRSESPLPIDMERLNLLLAASCRVRRVASGGHDGEGGRAEGDVAETTAAGAPSSTLTPLVVVVDPSDAELLVAAAVRRGERPTPATYHYLAGLCLAHEQQQQQGEAGGGGGGGGRDGGSISSDLSE